MNKKEQMMLMREQGLKYREIADIFGVSKQYVADVCGKCDPAHFSPIGSECVYPNLRKWMNENKISRKEFLRRMGLVTSTPNHSRFNQYIRGKCNPTKPYIDKMLKVTGMTYEMLFAEAKDG